MSKLVPHIIEYLQRLRHNNNKPWFEAHKPEYTQLKKDFTAMMEDVAFGVAEFDPMVQQALQMGGPKGAMKIYRIYRDARFSKGKEPYKTNFGAMIGPRKHHCEAPCYYLHLDPTGSFLGGGLYMPDKDTLSRIRNGLLADAAPFRAATAHKPFVDMYGDIDRSMALKTYPRGFDKAHPNIDLLRLKSFTAMTSLRSFTTTTELVDAVLHGFRAVAPLNKSLWKMLQ